MATDTRYLEKKTPLQLLLEQAERLLSSMAQAAQSLIASPTLTLLLVTAIFGTLVVGSTYVLLERTARSDVGQPELGLAQRAATTTSKVVSQAQAAVSQAFHMPSPADPIASAHMTLVSGLPIAEADNIRWSLIRRTPAAATVYDGSAVNWEALRTIEASGDVLVPAGFTWSVNETFQGGVGYRQASGILAGGHCGLATVFNAAAQAAGLPTHYNRHRTPYPGYTVDQSVNIYWGRDDLRVQNTLGDDFQFRWELTQDQIKVHVVPRLAAQAAPPTDWEGATIALTYGRPKGGWGTLGQTSIVDQALHVSFRYGDRVAEWNDGRPVVVAVNPNIIMEGKSRVNEEYIYHLIAEAERRNAYVMLDVQTGSQDPVRLFGELFDKYLRENVWFDWDLEHATGGRVHAAQINAIAADYFQRRAERGYQRPGVLAFYIFDMNAVQNPGELRMAYDNGLVLPIFDGFGPANVKIAQTNKFRQLFGPVPYGIMEFETRWGTRYDQIPAREYLAAFPDAMIFASQ